MVVFVTNCLKNNIKRLCLSPCTPLPHFPHTLVENSRKSRMYLKGSRGLNKKRGGGGLGAFIMDHMMYLFRTCEVGFTSITK